MTGAIGARPVCLASRACGKMADDLPEQTGMFTGMLQIRIISGFGWWLSLEKTIWGGLVIS